MSENHVYSKHIKNKNSKGFVVAGVPYLTLFEAEEACMKEGVPPDQNHLVHDPKQARELARVVYPEMKRIQATFERAMNKAQRVLKQHSERLEQIKPKDIMKQVEKELAEEKLHELMGNADEAYKNYKFISERCLNLYQIICLKDEGGT